MCWTQLLYWWQNFQTQRLSQSFRYSSVKFCSTEFVQLDTRTTICHWFASNDCRDVQCNALVFFYLCILFLKNQRLFANLNKRKFATMNGDAQNRILSLCDSAKHFQKCLLVNNGHLFEQSIDLLVNREQNDEASTVGPHHGKSLNWFLKETNGRSTQVSID